MVEQLDNVGIVLAGLVSEVPPGKALVMSVACVSFVDKRLVDIDFLPPTTPPPKEPRIVGAEEQFQVIFVGQRKEHLADVFVDWKKTWNHLARIDAFVLIARANDDDRIHPDPIVKLELAPPLPLRPVLTRDVVRDFVEKSTRDPGERRHAREFTDTHKEFGECSLFSQNSEAYESGSSENKQPKS